MQELSAHQLITVTNIHNPEKGYCANVYRFLWHPWMPTTADEDFRVTACEKQPPLPAAEPMPMPSEQQITGPDELEDTSPGELQITPLVIPSSPKENNKKTNYRGKVPASSPSTSLSKRSLTASPPPRTLSDTTKIMLERRIGDLRIEIAAASKKGNYVKSDQLHRELTAHQIALGFTPDDPPKPKAVPRKEESPDSTTLSDWPSPQEVRRTFSEVRRSRGWPTRDENLRSCGPVLRHSVSSCAEALLATKYEGTTLRAGRRHDNIVVTGSVG